MKFSEAIRLGAMMGPQLFGQELSNTDPTASCAFGGAILAAGIEIQPPLEGHSAGIGGRHNEPSGRVSLPEEWKPFCLSSQRCPAEHFFKWEDQGIHIVAHLNDHHRWTRERIADWVAEREAAIPAPPEPLAEVPRVAELSPLDVMELEAK